MSVETSSTFLLPENPPLQKDKIRREKNKDTQSKKSSFKKPKRHSQRTVERNVFDKLGTNATNRKCTHYTSVTWIIIASHPKRYYHHACWHMQVGRFRHIYIIWALKRPTPTTFYGSFEAFFLFFGLQGGTMAKMPMQHFLKRFLVRNRVGRSGEEQAERFVRQLGYSVLGRNVVNPAGRRLGEIDLIALDGTCVVFIEVKTRCTSEVPWRLAVSPSKLRRLARIGEWYMKHAGRQETDFRFDLVSVLLLPGAEPRLTHVQDIFL